MSPPAIDFAICPPAQPPASQLLEAMVAELHAMYGEPDDGNFGVPLSVEELAPPGGRYLVGRVEGEVVAGAGLRTVGAGMGEIKRMYVAPAWRGKGVARLLLAALEAEAASMGLDRLRLDTGSKQADARHLYLSAGYVEIGNYNDNPRASFWGEKRLSPLGPTG